MDRARIVIESEEKLSQTAEGNPVKPCQSKILEKGLVKLSDGPLGSIRPCRLFWSEKIFDCKEISTVGTNCLVMIAILRLIRKSDLVTIYIEIHLHPGLVQTRTNSDSQKNYFSK